MERTLGQLSKVVVDGDIPVYREYEDVEVVSTSRLEEPTPEFEDPFQNAVDEVVMAEEDKPMPKDSGVKRVPMGGRVQTYDRHANAWI